MNDNKVAMRLINKLKVWGGYIVASLVIVSCSGTAADGEATLTLKASKSSIDANGRDNVTFTVTSSGLDVTKEAEVRCVTTGQVVTETGFTTSEPKTYIFEASYGDLVSEQVSVSANEVKQSEFVRKVCLMEFTSISCTFCPEGYRRIEPVLEQYPEQLYLLSMHPEYYSGTADPLGIPQTTELEKTFKIGSYPYTLLDMREPADAYSKNVREALQRSFDEYPAHCGVAVSSVFNESERKAQVTVKLHSEKETDYRIAVYVVEDDIISRQLDKGIWRDDYIHHKVARSIVDGNVNGEKLGKVLAGEEAMKTWDISLDQSWNIDNLYIYALAIDEDGTVNNMNACLVKNGDSGYAKVNDND